MKRVILTILCLATIMGSASCSKSIEMKESNTYHFQGYDISFAVPKEWRVEPFLNDDLKTVRKIRVEGIGKDSKPDEGILFFVALAKKEHNSYLPEFNELNCKLFGPNLIYVPPYIPGNETLVDKLCGIYVDKKLILGLFFDKFPKNKITPELEAIFNSIEIKKS
jgi:hypothetical protein